MGPRHVLSAAVLLCLALVDVHGYVLRDRSWDEDNTLADALQVISRERRRLADEQQYSQGARLRPYYFDEPRSDVLSEDEAEEAEEAERQFLSRLFETPAAAQQEFLELPEDVVENEIEPAEEKKAVKRAELEGIFQPMGKRSPDKKDVEDSENSVELDEGQVKALLDAEEEAQAEEEDKNTDGEDEETEEVSEGELEDILGPDGKEEVKEEVDDEMEEEPEEGVNDVNAEWPEGINKEWLVEQYMEGQPPSPVSSIKRKRSDDGSAGVEEQEENAAMALLKQYLELEDDENSNLALALNQATKAQISSHPAQYIPAEIEFLQRAIADEEEIQKMREMLGDEDVEGVDEEAMLQEPPASFLSDETAVAPVEEKRAPPADLEDDDAVRKLLADKLQQYIMKVAQSEYAPEEEEDEDEADNEIYGGEEWDNAPLPYRQEGAEEAYDLNPFLRELIQKYRTGALEKRGQSAYEPEESNLVQTNLLDICPAVEYSTNDCAAARSLGLALDGEAMDLCNRHQTCYSCGASHGLTADDCDTGYLKEADMLCGDSEDCKDEAAALFVIMVEEHGYVPGDDNHYTCAADCTFDYIVGGGEK